MIWLLHQKNGNITANHLYKHWAERLNDYNNAEYSHRTVEIKLPEIDMARYTSPSIIDNK